MEPKRCCYNCSSAMKAGELTGDIASAIVFNKAKRFCGNHWKVPSYDMYERRYCKGFELSRYIQDYYYDKPNGEGDDMNFNKNN